MLERFGSHPPARRGRLAIPTAAVASLVLVSAMAACATAPRQMPAVCPSQELPPDVVPPKLTNHIPPDPRGPDGRFRSGIVCARWTITAEGVPVGIVITKRGDPLLERALVAAVSQWRYTPATRNGEPVDVGASFSLEVMAHPTPFRSSPSP